MATSRRTRKPGHPASVLAQQQSATSGVTLLSDTDLYYFNEGTHSHLYKKLGAHPYAQPGKKLLFMGGEFGQWQEWNHEASLVVCNFTPLPRLNYRVGAPYGGVWHEVLNSDARDYGGSGYGNMGEVETVPVPHHGQTSSLTLTVPPLAVAFFTSPAAE